ncbi:hypothetical protein [Devosia sp. A369]
MDATAEEGGGQGNKVTAIVVRYFDGRPTVIDDDTDDVCIVYQSDTPIAAVDWLFAERQFDRWCRRSEAIAEVVLVTVPMPADPADLEACLHVAARTATVTWGYVRTRISQAA